MGIKIRIAPHNPHCHMLMGGSGKLYGLYGFSLTFPFARSDKEERHRSISSPVVIFDNSLGKHDRLRFGNSERLRGLDGGKFFGKSSLFARVLTVSPDRS